jgi:hypothetical protein
MAIVSSLEPGHFRPVLLAVSATFQTLHTTREKTYLEGCYITLPPYDDFMTH